MMTFTLHLHVLARILSFDVKNPIGTPIRPGNILIVPLFLNSPDFDEIGISAIFKITLYAPRFAKGVHFGESLPGLSVTPI